jgi:hypothetical protein
MGYCKFSDTCTVRRAGLGSEARQSKRKGELAELVFVLKAASLGLGVCKPYGDSLPFDFVVASAGRLLRVQVKSAFSHKRRGFQINLGFRARAPQYSRYTARDIDFFALYVVTYDTWYIIPISAAANATYARVYPDGVRKQNCGAFEQYREAWHLMLGEHPAAPTSDGVCPCNAKISSHKSENGEGPM